MDKLYRLRYHGKWMKVKRMLGSYIYDLYDDPNEVEPVSLTKATAGKALVGEYNDVVFDEIEIVEVEQQ